MPDTIKCSFCNQPFEFNDTTGSLLATCPHCGKQNTNINVRGRTQHLKLIHDAPALIGVKFCPKCKKRIAADDNVCIHCGYNLITHKRIKAPGPGSGRRIVRILFGVVLLLAGAYALCRWLPSVQLEMPIPAEAPDTVPAAGGEVDAGSAPMDESSRLEAKKEEAVKVFRRKLDEQMPLYQTDDLVELRLRTGQIVRGTLRRYAGTGTNRTAIVATESGERFIIVKEVDRDARIRMDANYRENFIRHKLSLPPSAMAGTNTAQDGRSTGGL